VLRGREGEGEGRGEGGERGYSFGTFEENFSFADLIMADVKRNSKSSSLVSLRCKTLYFFSFYFSKHIVSEK
jgi:hypothetical protein